MKIIIFILEMNTASGASSNRVDYWLRFIEMQIKVARGEALTIKQEDLQIKATWNWFMLKIH
jgi:acetyl/propionyl-CoA carboxylase alpha subunit